MTSRAIYAIGPDSTVADAARKMKEVQKSCLLVMMDTRPVGILTETDVLRKVVAEGLSPAELKVSAVMSRKLRTIGPGESVSDAARAMTGGRLRRLVVMDGTSVVGIVTTTDLARVLLG